MIVLLAILVFFSAAALDVATTRYVRAATAGHAHKAARYSALMWAMSMVGTVLVLKVDICLGLAEVAGLYVGSWWAVDHARLKESCNRVSDRSVL